MHREFVLDENDTCDDDDYDDNMRGATIPQSLTERWPRADYGSVAAAIEKTECLPLAARMIHSGLWSDQRNADAMRGSNENMTLHMICLLRTEALQVRLAKLH